MVVSTRDEVLDASPQWLAGGAKLQKCTWCARPPIGYYPKPLEAVVMMRQRATVSGTHCVEIWRRALFEMIHAHEPRMVAGPVRFPGGTVLKDSVTVHFDPELEVVMRGGVGSAARRAYRRCPHCNRPIATRGLFMPPWNVLRSEVEGREFMVTTEACVLVTEQFWSRLDLDAFPDLYRRPVHVVDAPLERVEALGDEPV